MRFEWDSRKAVLNRRKHGIAFDEAITVFYDPLAATFADPDHSVEEQRSVTIGYSAKDRLLVICHTDTDEVVRLINARRATLRERKNHESHA